MAYNSTNEENFKFSNSAHRPYSIPSIRIVELFIKIAIPVGALLSVLIVARMLIPDGRYFAFYAVAAGLFVVGTGYGLPESYRLDQSGIHTQGTVREISSDNHCGFTYTFQSEKGSHTNQSRASAAGLDCASLRPGQMVEVAYLADRPEANIAGDPHRRWINAIEFSLAAALFFPAFIIYFYIRGKRSQ